MEKSSVSRRRENWLDDVKVIACILVVLGHFFQSMTKADILPSTGLYVWFNKTIYYFHVPLFFICSGYLYQKFSRVDSIRSWSKNVLKKLLALGVPYFAFSFATWLLKTIFSGDVNDQIGGLFETLFLQPASPYWYLYALFLMFLITPTFQERKAAVIGFLIVLMMKASAIFLGGGIPIYAVSAVFANGIWFIGGMCLAALGWRPLKMWEAGALGAVFLILSVLFAEADNGWISFFLGFMVCASIAGGARAVGEDRKQNALSAFLSRYTMPIFVMHTLFAAPFRTVLLKLGIHSPAVHVAGGIIISIAGPIVAAEIMKRTKYLEFFLYPGKFIKVK